MIRQSHRMQLREDGQILRINQLRNEDTGLYTCVAENTLQRISAATDLRVRDPSKRFLSRKVSFSVSTKSFVAPPLLSRRMSNLTTYDGAHVELECTATGEPEPKMEWFRDGTRIQYNMQYILKEDGSLLLPHVAANQSGYYTCQASNYAGNDIHSFWVTVVSKFRIVFSD